MRCPRASLPCADFKTALLRNYGASLCGEGDVQTSLCFSGGPAIPLGDQCLWLDRCRARCAFTATCADIVAAQNEGNTKTLNPYTLCYDEC
jgi:hypothetical protein